MLITLWLMAVSGPFARSYLSGEGITLMPPRAAYWTGLGPLIIAGLFVFAFAEVFNQGILLKQDSDLTI
jgi:hypothetical protein